LSASGDGGALIIQASQVRMNDCTIALNMSSDRGGGMYSADGSLELERTICWGNCAVNEGDQIFSNGNGLISCSDIDSSGIWADELVIGPGTIDSDPLFCDPRDCSHNTTEGDYHLRSDSPCLPEGNSCGVQMGSLGAGCTAPGFGACCFGDGTCEFISQDACAATHGTYQGDGTTCDPNPCEPTPVQSTTWGRIKASYR
jgi:hypothetical protein